VFAQILNKRLTELIKTYIIIIGESILVSSPIMREMEYATGFGLEIAFLLAAFALTFHLRMATAKASLEERDKLLLAAAD
jgi:hypothetical protein